MLCFGCWVVMKFGTLAVWEEGLCDLMSWESVWSEECVVGVCNLGLVVTELCLCWCVVGVMCCVVVESSG